MFRLTSVKKLVIFFLLPVLVIAWTMPGFSAYAFTLNDAKSLSLIEGELLQKIGPPSLPDISREARSNGLQPASLKNIHLKLKPGVSWLSEAQAQAIKNHASGGKISSSLLPEVEPGKIYIDPSSLIALEFVRGEGGILYILLADDDKLVEELSIPEQTVFLNEANITYLAQGINIASYKMKSGTTERAGFNFYFNEKQTLPGYDQEGKRVEVTLKGSLNIDSPAVEVKYTEESGYKFIFYASQRAEVQAELLAQLKKDVKIPLYDFTVPAEGCKITVGFFLVLGVDGKITLEYSVKQSSSVRAGLQGSTSYYLPTSFNVVKEVSFEFSPEELSLSADVKGELSLLAEVAFDILGKGKVILDNKIGVLLEAKAGVQGGIGDYLSIKGDGFAKIYGRVKIKSFDKSKTIYEYKYPIFNYVKARSSSYNIDIAEACAYRDIIQGSIVEKGTGKPYANQEILLKVTSYSGVEKLLVASTDNSGFFSRSFDLKKGDQVRVKIPGSGDLWSYPREASFPYNHVAVEVADYLSNTVKGYVSGSGQGLSSYNGPVSLFIERSNNIPLHHQEDLSLPVEYTIRLQAQSSGGAFQLQGVDLRPFDRVYAVVDSEGFTINSTVVEADGLTVSVAGGYLQEAHSLSSPNSTVVLGGPGTVPPFNGEAHFKVEALYPHSASPENSLKSREWRLQFTPVYGRGYSFAGTGPWELDLHSLASLITSPLDRFRSSLAGGRSVNYHVFESVKFYVEGKKLEYFNEAKTCEEERSSGLIGKIEKTVPLVGSVPAGYYLKTLGAIMLEGQMPAESPAAGDTALSAQNCAAGVTVKYYPSAAASTPSYSSNIKFSVLNGQQRVESGARDPILMWDKTAGTKVVQYQEFPRKESVRYDLDDYIPELQNVPFVLKGTEQVNGISCQVWEKSKKIDPIMNIYVKVQLFIAPGSNLPLKAVFCDGYYQKIELLFSNWQKASSAGSQEPGGSRLFVPPFGEIRLPAIQLELPASSGEETGESATGDAGESSPGNTWGDDGDGQSQNIIIALTIGDPYMTINGSRVEIDPGRGTVPLIKEGRTILPIRAVVEALGGSISWKEDERKITVAGKGTMLEMWVDSVKMLVNGASVTNDVPPIIIGARTYVPVRFVAENLNCDINWDGTTRTVTISSRQ
ncbi:MAG: hypothetical protein HPY66_1508 [Firmicutes bacterium]|nr:hypothetical protein [Bacillota bacterium]